jgi:O-glycosyl hydrolase
MLIILESSFGKNILANNGFFQQIPQMQEATRMQTTPLKFIGSSWSPPAWMKNNGELNHGGALKGRAGQYEWKQYARYLLKLV